MKKGREFAFFLIYPALSRLYLPLFPYSRFFGHTKYRSFSLLIFVLLRVAYVKDNTFTSYGGFSHFLSGGTRLEYPVRRRPVSLTGPRYLKSLPPRLLAKKGRQQNAAGRELTLYRGPPLKRHSKQIANANPGFLPPPAPYAGHTDYWG